VEAFRDIEARLSRPLFQGVPIGATLTDFFVINFVSAQFSMRRKAAMKAALGWWRFCLLGPRSHKRPFQLETNRLLFTWSADTPRLNDLVAPVLAEFDPQQCNVIGTAPSIGNKLDPAVGYCTVDQATTFGINRSEWRREYARCRAAWHRSLRQWLHDHHLPRRLFPHLAYALAVRSWQIMAFGKFLDALQPTAVLTEAEHNSPWSCLILAARHRGIPTMTMMHGVVYSSYGYTPLLSDVALCWGRGQVEQMTEQGVEPGRLLITGCQRLARTPRFVGMEVRARLGLPLHGPVVMLATGPMAREEWRKLVFAFGEAFQNHEGASGVVRLHASEKLDDYKAEMSRYPGIRFLENRRWSVEDAMAACDVVVIHNSGLGNDALVFQRLVILLDVLASPLGNGRVLANKAGSPVASTAGELRHIVDRIFADADYRQGLHRQAEEYVNQFCTAFGQDAARNVAAEVKRMARPVTSRASNSSVTLALGPVDG
jgi:hypothetical protein